MRHTTLGRTGIDLSCLGFGTWGIGGTMWIGADDDESARALRRAFELGVTFVDTAAVYGFGHAEELIGAALPGSSHPVVVASKVPPKNRQWPGRGDVPASEAFPGDWIREHTEQSLERLGVETLDLQQLHVWHDAWLEQGDWREAVEGLKRGGLIRAFGVSINNHAPDTALKIVASGLVDAVQVIYNVFDQSPEDELFPLCLEHGVGVIVRVPFDEGALAGVIRPDSTFPEGDFRNAYFAGDRKQQVWERARQIAADLAAPVEELASYALRFTLSHPAVTAVIPGMRSVRNVERNVAAAELGPLSEAQLASLRPHRWVRDFQG
jgi:aryl-alcohol dehydrogenase-like predicted oxidoreductase